MRAFRALNPFSALRGWLVPTNNIPVNAVTVNGEPVTINGEFITITGA